MRDNDCRESFKADAKSIFFSRTRCSIHTKHDKREPGFFSTKKLYLNKCTVFVARHIAAMTLSQINSSSVVKV